MFPKSTRVPSTVPPTVVKAYSNGYAVTKWLNDLRQQHRVGGPAVMTAMPDGTRSFEWRRSGDFHRLDGPAHVDIDRGRDVQVTWFRHGEQHRTDGPASTYHEAAEQSVIMWMYHGSIVAVCGNEDETWPPR